MAIYHLRATMISRSQGRSATAAIAYRCGLSIEDRRTGLTFDYSKKSGIEHTEVLAPDHAPDWVYDHAELWNRVEEAETRMNSQVAREIRVALPDALSHDERVDLVRSFCQAQFVDRGMVADIALHAPSREGDERNHHAHIMLTTREIDADGFTTKNRDWNAVSVLEGWREAWAQDSNLALERSGLTERIDHRTLEAQREEALDWTAEARERGDEPEELRQTVRAMELDRDPLPQLSPGAWQMKARGIEVEAVRVWHEVKDRAAEVMRLAQGVAEHVRDWLDRGLDRVQPEQGGLALAQGDDGREPAQDLAGRLRAAWEARQSQPEGHGRSEPDASTDFAHESADSLADRLRAAVSGLDPDVLSKHADTLREAREAEEQRLADIEAERVREVERLELEQDVEQERLRGKDLDYGIDY